jgi:hypothetical protein
MRQESAASLEIELDGDTKILAGTTKITPTLVKKKPPLIGKSVGDRRAMVDLLAPAIPHSQWMLSRFEWTIS